jgi:anti-sigma factor RsiW
MTCASVADRLDELLAGRLEGAELDALSTHLATCTACQAAAASVRALRDRAAALPRSIEPPRDLWPAIAAAIAAERPQALPYPRRSRLIWRFPAAAAAAVLLFAAGVGVAVVVLGRVRSERDVQPTVRLATLAAYRQAGAGYQAAEGELRRVFESRRERLAPETVATIEDSLRLIDRAVAEAWAALERDPASRAARDAFTRLHRRKLDVLRTAARATQL